MKGLRWVVFILCLTLFLLAVSAFAESNEIEGFIFRDIPWYTDMPTVLKTTNDLCAKKPSIDQAKLNSMELDTIDFDTRVEDGGMLVYYGTGSITVAGYNTSCLALQFMFPIKDDNTIDRRSDYAEFYMAQYRIGKQQYENIREVFDDLVAKLNNLYGEGTELNKSHVLWKAADGSMIGCGFSGYEIQLTYLAPDADARLNALKVIVDKEIADKEAAEREKNSDNFDGL